METYLFNGRKLFRTIVVFIFGIIIVAHSGAHSACCAARVLGALV